MGKYRTNESATNKKYPRTVEFNKIRVGRPQTPEFSISVGRQCILKNIFGYISAQYFQSLMNGPPINTRILHICYTIEEGDHHWEHDHVDDEQLEHEEIPIESVGKTRVTYLVNNFCSDYCRKPLINEVYFTSERLISQSLLIIHRMAISHVFLSSGLLNEKHVCDRWHVGHFFLKCASAHAITVRT